MYTMPGGLGSDFRRNQEETMEGGKKGTGGETGFDILNRFNGFLALNTQTQNFKVVANNCLQNTGVFESHT
jgi:hypothetical protein